MTIAANPRQRCYRCMRPSGHCICDELPTVRTRTSVVVIQHPQERGHPFGTAKLLGLSMPRARVHTVHGGLSRNLHCPLELPDGAALLYPHADAEDLADLGAAEHPSTLVALDGTWSHSRRLYHENPWLRSLRHVRITPSAPSRYRIRREPGPEYVSTLEAVVSALRILEPETRGFDELLAAFDRMIDRQVDHSTSGDRQVRYKRPRARESRRLSPLLDDPGFVVLYAESSLPGGDTSARRELVQVVGARLRGGEAFEVLVRPEGEPPAGPHLRHMGLSLGDLDAAPPLAEARELLQRHAGAGPFGAWNKSSLDWSAPLLPPNAARTVLKTSYCNLVGRSAGFLEHVVEREGLELPEVDCRGRAAQRLANALAVSRWLQRQRSSP